ncbi:hydrogen gas-evolving membrane-bound hydrogenase subunit E [Prauserella muralis]|uniref:NADH dehydrogenase n=1 Tax=Prauserella muralis TaxID=588067 RepID=A0A2V4AIE9_9PSEU|nr:hydrogen gas-evolving membrane-bound hydrogenase subunit E [Prauserella muralis]PXY19708.1 NADH dehydrogenase [Prauserella muralis]TWE29235.1 multicomponent Na+:H+ antiporter subunit A [Prauserella muralis]
MLIAIAALVATAAVLPAVARRWGRAAFAVGSVVVLATLGLALVRYTAGYRTESLAWAPVAGLEFTVRLDALALLMTVLVSGIGAVVLAYFTRYASRGEEGIGRDAAVLVLFAGAMLGLVLADDVLSLYLFWELTSICSFLLVGGNGLKGEARRAAKQALLVTILGGLAMLLGLILLGTAAGTFRVSELVASPPGGGVAVAGIVLVLVGVFTKSAQLPFHPWLPAAMVAPTPVSAYLHAAAMVKAGVYLVARLAPAFAERPVWWVPLVVIGLATMVLGGWRALRQHDLKLLLAFGTVSQLGFLLVLLAVGTYTAALAGAALLLAHGLFKSALFLTAGVIDTRAGTRDVRELSGLGRRWPLLAACATLAAASMAGLPPLVGFVAKEAAFKAFTHADPRSALVLVGVLAGSVLTVAYTLRFLIGAFGGRGAEPGEVGRPGVVLTTAVAVPVAASVVLGVAPGVAELLAGDYAGVFGAATYHLELWHGFTPPLLESAIVLAAGYLLYRRTAAATRAGAALPGVLDAQRGYRAAVVGLEALARGVTSRLQTGSLPAYVGIILVTVIGVPAVGLLTGPIEQLSPRAWNSALQLPLTVLALAAAATVPFARRRLTAVLLTGLVGYAIGGVFLVVGAPDLALAQVLVETLTLVVFVFVLRRFPPAFRRVERESPLRHRTRLVVACAGGAFVALLTLVFSSLRERPSEAGAAYVASAKDEAGATNVVNAIIVDFRALDTLGEITVLLVAATGAASLGLAARSARRRALPTADGDRGQREDEEVTA